MIKANELREKYLNFFGKHGHAVIPSASLIPENDPTVLFTTAGMHPLVPYLLGERHPAGTRLCDVQKCIRTGDIEEVGDASHLTFFEMLGNWSLGDYFKKEAIQFSYEFLTSPEYLGLPLEKLAVTVFEGDDDAPRDTESAQIWMDCGMPEEKIFYLTKKHNWWGPAGKTGPCGPDTEMFYITDREPCGPDCSPACSCGRYLEIWNDVFMQYNKTAEGTFVPLEQKNVDTGMGLERTICVLQGKKSVYETDLFAPIIAKIEELSGKKYGDDDQTMRAMRVVADHARTSTFILGDERGVTPSNLDQGYVLRRIIRRAVRYGRILELPDGFLWQIAKLIIENYAHYPELRANKQRVHDELNKEEARFAKTLNKGLAEFEKIASDMKEGETIDGQTAFRLYDTFGFPIEITQELAAERGLKVDTAGFEQSFDKHREVSAQGSEQRFKGGLADNTEATARLHTATHLLHAALRNKFGEEVEQRGSNITAERMRFDFSFPRKIEADELQELETWVNAAIAADVPIDMQEMSVDAAKEGGAIGLFSAKYGDVVKVYTMGKFSKEICGGPHAERTGEIGKFIIQKEQASSSGVRRIRAVLE